MRVVKTKKIAATQVILPANWRDGLNLTVVTRIADSLRAGRAITPIRLDRLDTLVYGRHRVAAALDAKVPLLAQVVIYDDEAERLADVLWENLGRVHMSADERTRLLGPAVAELGPVAVAAATGISRRTLARDKAAKEGKKPTRKGQESTDHVGVEKPNDSVGTHVGNGTNVPVSDPLSTGGQEPKNEPAKHGLDGFDDLGLDVDAALWDELADLTTATDAVAVAVSVLKGKLTELSKLMDARPALARRFRISLWEQQADAIGAGVRASRPVAVCHYCKLEDRECQGCVGTRYVTRAQLPGVPDELRVGGADAVVFDGKGLRAPKKLNVVVEDVPKKDEVW